MDILDGMDFGSFSFARTPGYTDSDEETSHETPSIKAFPASSPVMQTEPQAETATQAVGPETVPPTVEDVNRLQLVSAYKLRTFAVGSVLPMCRSKLSVSKMKSGLMTILNKTGPDPKVLAILRCEGFALRAVSWRTSSSLRIHNGIMQLAGEVITEESAMVATVDPSLDCLRSERFISLIRDALETEGITDIERSVLVGATLSLVLKTPSHPCIAVGDWDERVVDMVAETKHLDGARVMLIPENDKAALKEKINNTLLIASIAEETDVDKTSELCSTLKFNKKGWLDTKDKERALTLIDTSVVLLAGLRHIAADRDNLLLDPATCDVSCMHDVSRRNAVLRGATPRSLDVPLEFFNLHMAIIMAAAIRVVAKYAEQDRDTMMKDLSFEEPVFEQQPYLAKTWKRSLAAVKETHSPEKKQQKQKQKKEKEQEQEQGQEQEQSAGKDQGKKLKMTRRRQELDERFVRLSDDVAVLRAECDARFKILEAASTSKRVDAMVDDAEDI